MFCWTWACCLDARSGWQGFGESNDARCPNLRFGRDLKLEKLELLYQLVWCFGELIPFLAMEFSLVTAKDDGVPVNHSQVNIWRTISAEGRGSRSTGLGEGRTCIQKLVDLIAWHPTTELRNMKEMRACLVGRTMRVWVHGDYLDVHRCWWPTSYIPVDLYISTYFNHLQQKALGIFMAPSAKDF